MFMVKPLLYLTLSLLNCLIFLRRLTLNGICTQGKLLARCQLKSATLSSAK